jgi:hypothetical protein
MQSMANSRFFEVALHHAQFEIWDEGAGRDPGEPSAEAFKRGFVLSDSFLSVLAHGDGQASVSLEMLGSKPRLSPGWERGFEVSLNFPTGHFQVHECTGLAVEAFTTSPGWSRFRVQERPGRRGGSHLEFSIQVWPSPQAAPEQLLPEGAV